MRGYFPDLYGNDRLRGHLGRLIENAALSHAYLIEGPAGSGKYHLALRIAAALQCENRVDPSFSLPCMRCDRCRRVLGGICPDVMVFERGERATIGIETVRKLKSEAVLSPSESEHKVYIIRDAHTMTVEAQNALLILLEEPPADVMIFLLCENTDAMLETVRSRVQILHMERFSAERLYELTPQCSQSAAVLAQSDPDRLHILCEAAEGRIGEVIALTDPKRSSDILARRARIDRILEVLLSPSSYAMLSDAIGGLPTKRAPLTEELALLHTALRDLILLRRSEEAPLCYFYRREDAVERAEGVGMRRLFDAIDAVSAAIDALGRNANVSATISLLTIRLKGQPI